MRHILNVLLLIFVSVCISLGVSGVSFFTFDVNFFLAGLYGFISFWLSSIPLTILYVKRYRKLNESNLYRKKNIKAAQRKVRQLLIYKYKSRSFDRYQKIDRLYRAANQILKVVKEDPARYYAAKKFFSDYLDSALLITQKYSLFLQQPVQSRDVQASLKESEITIEEMTKTFEHELMEILSKDRMSLDLEVEYVRQSIKESPKH